MIKKITHKSIRVFDKTKYDVFNKIFGQWIEKKFINYLQIFLLFILTQRKIQNYNIFLHFLKKSVEDFPSSYVIVP